MAISIVECKTYEINHLRRRDTLEKVTSEFYFEMVSRQSDHNDVFVAKLKHKLRHEILCWETAISDNSNSIIINDKTLSFFQLRSVLLQGFTPVAAMLMMVIA